MAKTIRRIHIFRPGTHTTAAGKAIDFSEADVARSVAVYDPARHEAPLVVGHPKDTAPAYGYVQSLTASEDGQIHALPHQVSSDFAELVESGAYKHVSASFYSPGSPTHPLAGTDDHDTWYLRHVGFLGAQPPAIKGLGPVEFAEGEEGVVEFSEAWNPAPGAFARLARRLREYFVAEKDLETADQIVPSWEVESLERAAAEHDVRQQLSWEKTATSFAEVEETSAEGDTDTTGDDSGSGTADTAADDAAARLADLERREAELAERERKAQERETAAEAERQRQAEEAADTARTAAATDFAERIVAEGRALPRDLPALAYVHPVSYTHLTLPTRCRRRG